MIPALIFFSFGFACAATHKLARLDLCGTKKELEGVDQKEAERPADRKPLEGESCGKGRFRRLGAVGCG